MRLLSSFVLFLLVLASSVYALYEDQAGNLDWSKQSLGPIKSALFSHHRDRTQLILASNLNVLASISLKNGAPLWRQVLEPEGTMLGLEISGKGVVSIGGNSKSELSVARMWNVQSGKLSWELSLHSETPELFLDSQIAQSDAGALYLLTSSRLLSISLDGQLMWSVNVEGNQLLLTKQRLVVLNPKGESLSVTSFDLDKGSEISKESFKIGTEYALLDTKVGIFNKATGKLQVVDFSGQTTQSKEFSLGANLPAGTEVGSFVPLVHGRNENHRHFLLQGQDKVFLVSASETNLQVSATIAHKEGYHYLLEWNDGAEYLVQVTPSSLEVLEIKGNVKSSVPVPANISTSGQIRGLFLGPVQKKNAGPGFRVLLASEDMSVHLFREDGWAWTNEEALATIQHTSFVDLPVDSIFLKSDLELDEQYLLERSVLENYLHRVKKHLLLLQDIAASWITFLEGLSATPDRTQLKGDIQGIRKVIVASSEGGKVFGLDSANGNIVWTLYFPGVTSGSTVLIRGAASHHPISLYIGSRQGETVLAYFDPVTGQLEEGSPFVRNFSVVHLSKLVSTGHHHTHFVLIVDKSLGVHLFPENEDTSAVLQVPAHFFLWDSTSLKGYQTLRADGKITTLQTWSIALFEDETILSVAEHSPQEKVASLGRVLGDRSVLYKYLNPHSIAVATSSESRETIHIYVIDSVSGAVLSHQYHSGATGPVSMVLCEHWLAYHHWNQKEHQNQLSILEFYESVQPDNRVTSANFSSYSGLTPDVLSQSYVFPTGVTAMGVTETKKGISSRMVALALSSDQIYGIPKRFLDPRRHTGTQSAEDKEEGLIPYEVLMPINFKSVISYNQTVSRVRSIVAAPANLESTSLLLSYGLDIFFVRTAPSKIFDALTDEFEYALLLTAIAGMTTALVIAWYFARRKELTLLWH